MSSSKDNLAYENEKNNNLVRKYKIGRAWSDESFKGFMREFNPKVEVLGSFVNTKVKIKSRCTVCGNEWETIPGNLLKGTGCRKCHTEKNKRKFRKTKEQFIAELEEKNPDFVLLGDYINFHTPVKIQCKKCHEIIFKRPDRILNGECCPKCSFPTKKTRDQFILELKEVNQDIDILGDYITSRDAIKCQCKKCGTIWYGMPHHLLRGIGCPHCNLKNQTSYTEKYIYYFLKFYSKTIVENRSTRLIDMELDVFMPEKKIAIEYGSWHWHEHRYENDMLKLDACKKVGIELLVIYDGYEGAQIETDNIWTYSFVYSKQNISQLQMLCEHINDFFDLKININDVDWKRINRVANRTIKKMDMKEVYERIQPEKRGFVIIDSFENIHDIVRCECLKCGNVWETKITSLLYNAQSECRKCSAKKINLKSRKAVYKIDLSGEILQEYPSIADVAKDSGVTTSKICSVCKGQRKTAGGFAWKYVIDSQ